MLYLLLAPFLIQSILIIFDEGKYHIKRGLPKWERIGHPVDTLSFVLCLFFVQITNYTATNLIWYILVSSASCLLITKDEFVHKHHCEAGEQWVHAVMFVNHSVMLTTLGLLWYAVKGACPSEFFHPLVKNKELISQFLKAQTLFTVSFMAYQIIYWNIIWKPQQSK
jgi:hypothetical protein